MCRRRRAPTPFTARTGCPPGAGAGPRRSPCRGRLGVEERDVGGHARAQQAAVGKAEPLRRQRRHLAHALPGEDPELAHVDGEVARERAPAARVRPVADEDPVAAGGVRRVRHRRPHVLLVAEWCTSAERRGSASASSSQTKSIGALARRAPRLGDRASVDARPLTSPSGSRGSRRSPRPRSRRAAARAGRVAQPLERRRAAADVHPARQERVQVRGAGEVRIGVERDLDPVVARLVDHREQLAGARPC